MSIDQDWAAAAILVWDIAIKNEPLLSNQPKKFSKLDCKCKFMLHAFSWPMNLFQKSFGLVIFWPWASWSAPKKASAAASRVGGFEGQPTRPPAEPAITRVVWDQPKFRYRVQKCLPNPKERDAWFETKLNCLKFECWKRRRIFVWNAVDSSAAAARPFV